MSWWVKLSHPREKLEESSQVIWSSPSDCRKGNWGPEKESDLSRFHRQIILMTKLLLKPGLPGTSPSPIPHLALLRLHATTCFLALVPCKVCRCVCERGLAGMGQAPGSSLWHSLRERKTQVASGRSRLLRNPGARDCRDLPYWIWLFFLPFSR